MPTNDFELTVPDLYNQGLESYENYGGSGELIVKELTNQLKYTPIVRPCDITFFCFEVTGKKWPQSMTSRFLQVVGTTGHETKRNFFWYHVYFLTFDKLNLSSKWDNWDTHSL